MDSEITFRWLQKSLCDGFRNHFAMDVEILSIRFGDHFQMDSEITFRRIQESLLDGYRSHPEMDSEMVF